MSSCDDTPLISILNEMAHEIPETEHQRLRDFAASMFASKYLLKDFMQSRLLIPQGGSFFLSFQSAMG